jgi:hypothetical protein
MKMTVLWDVVPCSLVKIDQLFRGAHYLHHQGPVDRGISISETLVSFYQTTQHNIPEDSHLLVETCHKGKNLIKAT